MPHYTIVETPYGLRPEPVEQTHLGIWIFSRGRYTYNLGKSVNPREIFDSFNSARAAIAERQAACRHQWLNYANGRQCKSCRLWQEKTKEEKKMEKKKKQKREALLFTSAPVSDKAIEEAGLKLAENGHPAWYCFVALSEDEFHEAVAELAQNIESARDKVLIVSREAGVILAALAKAKARPKIMAFCPVEEIHHDTGKSTEASFLIEVC